MRIFLGSHVISTILNFLLEFNMKCRGGMVKEDGEEEGMDKEEGTSVEEPSRATTGIKEGESAKDPTPLAIPD